MTVCPMCFDVWTLLVGSNVKLQKSVENGENFLEATLGRKVVRLRPKWYFRTKSEVRVCKPRSCLTGAPSRAVVLRGDNPQSVPSLC